MGKASHGAKITLWAILMGLAVALALPACSDDGGGDDTKAAQDAGSGEPTAEGWQVVTDDYADGALLSVWAGKSDDVWMVGGEKSKAVALQFDGKAWKRNDPPLQQQLWWVHGFATGERVVVGESGSIAMYAQATWTVHDTGLPGATFFGVWGAAADDIWAVGGPWTRAAKGAKTDKTVLLHYDGKAWTRVDVSKLVHANNQSLFKVWGSAADDVWIVGDQGTVLHYDGKAWSKQDSGLVGVVLFTVHGHGGDVYAVGGFGSAAMLHGGKAGWKSMDPGEWAPTLQGVRVTAGGDVWVSGWNGYVGHLSAGKWTEYEVGTQRALHAVTVDDKGTVWAVGGNITTLQDDHVGTIAVRGTTVPKP